jgi:SAM-dependent methyltransferase
MGLTLGQLVDDLKARSLLLHSDPMVLDRWLWLKQHLPAAPTKLLDAGSGNGCMSINAGRLGHRVVGLNHSDDEVRSASRRNPYPSVEFQRQDLRELKERVDLAGQFPFVICAEVIEHLIEDEQLMRSLAALLSPGGTLLLTTPNIDSMPLDRSDHGPWLMIEDGRHVRKGYDARGLTSIAEGAGLTVDSVEYCSGDRSQRLTTVYRVIRIRTNPRLAAVAVSPFLPWPLLGETFGRPAYSICIVATKASD